jgi:hypothetical protein
MAQTTKAGKNPSVKKANAEKKPPKPKSGKGTKKGGGCK